METITKTIEIYDLDELSKEARQHAIDKQIDYLHTDMQLGLFLQEDLEERLSQDFNFDVDELKLEFSLSHCQGDGVAFYGTNLDIKPLLERNFLNNDNDINDNYDKYIILLDKFEEITLDITRNSFGHHYSHWNTMNVELNYENLEAEEYDFIDKFLLPLCNQLENDLKDFIQDTSKFLEQKGYEYIEHHTSEESAIEILNEYQFTENGEIH